uniref:NADH-ubiquinone oxidoreductase chain 3 n=1 Tax=Habroteleia persimilis TaxID=2496286 RepID=A0A3S8V135_9HYME|nr:NADH dehydrogenase subunit 3 [Habroteleia persimilis]
MFYVIIFIMLIFMLSFIIYLMNLLISKKMFNIREKSFPLECGFNMINNHRLPFSIQFYYISILFLIFDIEISLIMPMIQKLYYNNFFNWLMTFLIIMIILLIGLMLEWINNLIKWN